MPCTISLTIQYLIAKLFAGFLKCFKIDGFLAKTGINIDEYLLCRLPFLEEVSEVSIDTIMFWLQYHMASNFLVFLKRHPIAAKIAGIKSTEYRYLTDVCETVYCEYECRDLFAFKLCLFVMECGCSHLGLVQLASNEYCHKVYFEGEL